ncbi:MAG: hypothetical protein QM449_09565 [Synergistota bacterium]|nr:hypothetical protein [Synergistota bacterium]
MYGELTRIDMLEKEKAQLLKVVEAAKYFIEAWDRFYKVEPGSPGEQAAEDLACVRMEILKEAVTGMQKEAE